MKANLVLLAGSLVAGAWLPADSAVPVIDNERAIVWDLESLADLPDQAVLAGMDVLAVFEAPTALEGSVMYLPKGSGTTRLRASGATRLAIVALKDHAVAPITGPAGVPDAFPRAGRLSKPLDNARVTVWDYTFQRGAAVPTHFHARDVVTVYLTTGRIESTAVDGTKSDHAFTPGSMRFNPRGRTHTETLVEGEGHIIAVELK